MRTTLSNAILYNQVELVKKLLAQKVDVNEIDDYGYTPLIETAIANQVDLANLLLEHGARVNESDVVGGTALSWAVENHNMPLCRLLLKHKANPNAYTRYGQPILVKPILRHQQDLKELLYQYGANLKFAQDYINAKLIAHRFELQGRVDIVDPDNNFIEIDFSGFILEFTVSIILESLLQFKNNFSARHLRKYFDIFNHMMSAFAVADELLRYQHYTLNVKDKRYTQRIHYLINANKLLFLPLGAEGHAVSIIKYGNYWIKCDRGVNSLHEPSVIIYHIGRPEACTNEFIMALLYNKQSQEFIHHQVADILKLQSVAHLALPSQITGNCSWANVEAAIAAMLFILLSKNKRTLVDNDKNEESLTIFKEWHEWDKDRALHQCIENFYTATDARKATIATLLAAVLFQTCRFEKARDLPRINKILNLFSANKEYNYILQSYLKIYQEENNTPLGKNFSQLLDIAGK